MEDIKIQIITPHNEEGCNCLICPNCGQHEVNCEEKDENKRKFYIKAFRVDNSSHCLKCNCWFDLDGTFYMPKEI